MRISDFTIIKVIGKGYMGKVMVVSENSTNEIFALKSIHKKSIIKKKEFTHTKNERDILAQLVEMSDPCPFHIKVHAIFHDSFNVYYLMDFHGGGDFSKLISQMVILPINWCRFYAAQVLVALESLHARRIIYRDLKPENIMLSMDGNIVLVDFGLGVQLGEGEVGTMTLCGTPEYLAPEILEGKLYNFSVDIWCFGVLLFELIAGIPPFWDERKAILFENIKSNPPTYPNLFPEVAKHIINQLLCKDPQKRLSIQTIKEHEFFSGINWEYIRNLYYKPPFVPKASPGRQNFDQKGSLNVSRFDTVFTKMQPMITPENSCIDFDFKGFTFKKQE